ncbi:MAG: hypothetical protein PHR98_01420 [Candidatus Shapirobacteria bacterium]|nr:hypothetical protein [Candidatus Shapirobacteria bacterium]
MSIKKIFQIAIVTLVIVMVVGFLFLKKEDKTSALDQSVYEKTLSVSKEYTLLRYRTENVLEKAKEYGDYDKWNEEMGAVIEGWKALEGKVTELEKEADKMASEKTAFNIVKDVSAYTTVEIQKVIESAPAGKTVRTLAKHLGVDVKLAHLILNQTQDQMTREAYGEEGDVFETCEQNSMRIKNGAKVTVFVGGVVLTGGATGVLATTATVVGGADLVLEVADDEARIALGDKNKVSEMVNKARAVTEPAASILTIANLPGNVSKAMEKVSAGYFAADQIRSAVQDEKILGISIKTDEKGETKASVTGLSEEELPQWMKENNIVKSGEKVEEIMKQIEEEIKQEEKPTEVPKEETKEEAPKTNNDNNSAQVYKIVNVSGQSYMMDVCHNPTCWDDLAANEAEDRDVGGIYTMGKVYGPGDSFKHGFRPSDNIKTSEKVEMFDDGYKITVYFAIAPFEGPKNKTIEYGTWQNHSVEINAKYGDEPVIEWDGSSLKQAQ